MDMQVEQVLEALQLRLNVLRNQDEKGSEVELRITSAGYWRITSPAQTLYPETLRHGRGMRDLVKWLFPDIQYREVQCADCGTFLEVDSSVPTHLEVLCQKCTKARMGHG